MDATFPALLIRDQVQGSERVDFIRMDEADLMPGDVEVAVHYSSLNYKDALGITGSGRVLRRSPIVGGIDAAGEVIASSDTRFKPGDPVLVTGAGLGEYHHGGFAGRIRVPADWVVPLPAGMDCRQAMILGTAGLTTALILKRFQENQQLPEMGPILVTGASGGVGALTISLLAAQGYEVVGLTGKPEMAPWLRSLGASEVLDRHGLSMGFRPLETARWGGAVDVLGGEVLGWLARTVDDWGNIVVVGLAGGADLRTTVMPFILRGVSLLGVTSANCPLPMRGPLWERLGSDWAIPHLDSILSEEATLSQLPEFSRRMLAGRTWGRILVNPRADT
ncbi:YhdH/YhfP family quinone oxidoreductase [Ectothiorhodospira shaposhnikovii]|uniref:YhdH/YhfP family quinone oxidoreductase n=1 Tax=Ectothiorhodospira shaposhnikovii TaxID=1054 RepID=UPI001EE96BFD|nr:YhdH/YhfP family quinone oxidoreductase [Ectothiorhodospira shaposhnikovii]MCG5514457.1 YhdH/YhfP family quinone oxidoreductase [Ectothiorhodospira shaposhnikovii]